jgi:signal transduction histidine kinase
VEEHSGHIRIEDMTDKGVLFVITLPIAQAEASHGFRVDNK